jgi:hypothetical protein
MGVRIKNEGVMVDSTIPSVENANPALPAATVPAQPVITNIDSTKLDPITGKPSVKKEFGVNANPKKEEKSNKPSLFDNLNPIQQLLAMIFMVFAQMMNPGTVQAMGLDKTFSKIVGVDNFDQYKDWHKNMESKGWNWKETQDFSKFDFNEAKNFAMKHDNLTFSERQKSVMSVMDDAAKTAGVQQEFLAGLWGVESSFGKNRKSPSGCLGDFQFTQKTFKSMMNEHGDVIADRLRAQGDVKLAERIEKGGNLLDLRDDPKVATYAAAFYAKDVAKSLGVDAKDQKNWGIIYAGYNIGPGNADKLDGSLANRNNVKTALGDVAKWNPKFFTGGASGLEALQNYQREVEANLKKFLNIADAPKDDVKEPKSTSYAKNVDGEKDSVKISAKEPFDKAGDPSKVSIAAVPAQDLVAAEQRKMDAPKPSTSV